MTTKTPPEPPKLPPLPAGTGHAKEYRSYKAQLREEIANNKILPLIQNEYTAISPATGKPEPFTLERHQFRILAHAFAQTPTLRYKTIVYSAPKKSGKTAIGAAIGWAWSRAYGGEIYVVANAQHHARDRAFSRIHASIQHNPSASGLADPADLRQSLITLQNPYSRIEAIPCEAGSQAGGFQALTLFDELWNYDSEALLRLYSEMQPIDTIPYSLRVVTTYAGYYGESSLLWQIYQDVVKPDEQDRPQGLKVPGLLDLPVYVSEDGHTLVYWDHERRMPWQRGDAYLEAARADPICKLRPAEFSRLHLNRWVAGKEAFVDQGLLDRAVMAGQRRGLVNHL